MKSYTIYIYIALEDLFKGRGNNPDDFQVDAEIVGKKICNRKSMFQTAVVVKTV